MGPDKQMLLWEIAKYQHDQLMWFRGEPSQSSELVRGEPSQEKSVDKGENDTVDKGVDDTDSDTDFSNDLDMGSWLMAPFRQTDPSRSRVHLGGSSEGL